MARGQLTMEETLALLRATPERVAALTAGLTPAHTCAGWPARNERPHIEQVERIVRAMA